MNMMNDSMAPSIPEDTQPADFNRIANLIAVLADPSASKAALAQIAAAHGEAQLKIDDAVTKGARIEIEEREHNEKLKREREEHASALAAAQTSFEQECQKREKELVQRETVANDVKREAEKLMKEAQALKVELDRRAEKIRVVSAAL